MKRLVCFALLLILCVFPLNVSAVSTSAKSAILICGDSGEVIFEQNADERLSMASTTKIMTGLLLCENGNLEKTVIATDEMLRVEGSSMGLLPGDTVSLHDLLYGLMLASGNDAANVIAYTLGKTPKGFVKMMNEKAKLLGLNNTNFVTPSGLDSEEHYTTARDMAKLTAYALQNETFSEVVATSAATLNYGNPPYKRTLTNHNKLLKIFDGAIGVKTGFTKKSGRCLVSAARRDGKLVIAVTLNDPNDWEDHKSLLEYGISAVKSHEIKTDKDVFDVPVISGDSDTLELEITPFTVNTVGNGNFSYEIHLPKFVYAPVKTGDVIGEVVYKNNNVEIKRAAICSENSIGVVVDKPNFLKQVAENVKYIFRNIWVK